MRAGISVEVRPFVPVHSSEFHFSNPFSVQVGLNNNPVDVLVGTDIFSGKPLGMFGIVMTLKPPQNRFQRLSKDSGICWDSVIPKAYWGGSPILGNAVRIIVFPRNF